MNANNSIDSWLAAPDQEDTVVLDPVIIEPKEADLALRRYHPKGPIDGACRFRLVADSKIGYAKVEVNDDRHWNADFLRVLRSLRFQGAWKGTEFQYLKADPIPTDQQVYFRDAKWHVVDWRIVRTVFNPKLLELEELTEVIKWQDKKGNEAMSTYGWRVYKPKTQGMSPYVLHSSQWIPS